ncbi:hypothetical protein BLX87_03200 [Bacillus sp. VT-16-64]|uniref:YesK family protein n=1 Tax=Siminovitchia thermophila TaxID=1245522 RepID=UPI00097E04CF|nr:hypothetical protein BLX87_03200 [Bacillus sp. VT-16-64]
MVIIGGLHVFLIAGLLSIFIFYVASYYLKKKYPHRIYYLLPAIIITVCLALFAIFSIFTAIDGWVVMGNFFFAFAIVTGAFIGTFLPFLFLKSSKLR